MDDPEQLDKKSDGTQTVTPPSISLPKGGGAIRGIGEKFAANPVTGTGNMSVPIATSPGRSGFGPQLSLSYDSGAGNGPFGFGWNISLPSITRKTDKGLPQYLDSEESDIFLLSGAEDLVPVYRQDPDGSWVADHPGYQRDSDGFWVRDPEGCLVIHEFERDSYRIRRYRPRIEGLFARIERWSNRNNDTDVFWRSISTDNITIWYGRTGNSRIADPEDKSRIFSWLISESYDDKGNAITYSYKGEDSDGILDEIHEKNRTPESRSANRYIKRIQYGNKSPNRDSEGNAIDPSTLPGETWMFNVVFDYGEHDEETPLPATEPSHWTCRNDPFSSYRAGFEVRTYRLCQRVLMFHHFPGEEGVGRNCLVRSTDFHFSYEEKPDELRDPIYSFLLSVSQSGYKRREGGYNKKSLPPLEFEYSQPTIAETIEELDQKSLDNLPYGFDNVQYQWVDLDGEGISGVLTEQAGAWYYKRNLSPVNEEVVDGRRTVKARFGALETVALMPSNAATRERQQQFLDLAGDGRLDLVALKGPTPGFNERTQDGRWESFRPFESLPNLDWNNPNLKFVDLTGDGHADILITEDEVFSWYLSLAETGFGPAERVSKEIDEEKGPKVVFADGTQCIYLSDMSGDGLTDIARIRNGEVCYWPNLGYGRFGDKVSMGDAPWFDHPDQFDQRRIRLADIDGSGTTDILYLGRHGVQLYFNESGNGWSDERRIATFPVIDDIASIQVADLLGNGTACLVWSSPLPGYAQTPMRYLDLMGGQKPHLMEKTVNNLGAETHIQYAPSTRFYLQDKLAGKPWITRLPFPVHCVEKVTVKDKRRQSSYSTQYTYHHGYFDGTEREFRGFGRVEQVDVEAYGEFVKGNEASPYITDDKTLYQPPVKTITWFHTGSCIDWEHILNQLKSEYFPNWLEEDGFSIETDYAFCERALPEPDLTDLDLSASEWHEAFRACKGMTLRQEVYELDVDALEEGRQVPVKLFTSVDHNCRIRRIQPQSGNRHAVFLVTESEALTYHYELELRERIVQPDPRINHSLVVNSNEYGQPLQQVTVTYPRVSPFTPDPVTDVILKPETCELINRVQEELHIGYIETTYTDDVDGDDHYRLRLPWDVRTYEVKGIGAADEDDLTTVDRWDDRYFTLEELGRFRFSEVYQPEGVEVESIPYHHVADGTEPQKRLVEHVRTLYFNEDLINPLAPGELNHLGLTFETYKLALTEELLDAVHGEKLEDLVQAGETRSEALNRELRSGGYYPWEGQWWVRSGIAGFAPDAKEHFYLPERYIDPFDQVTEIAFDEDYDLYVGQTTDPVGNTTSVDAFDFRLLSPVRIKDPNDNLTAVAFDTLGLPVATAVMGNEWTESGDTLAGLQEDLGLEERIAFFAGEAFDEAKAREWLAQATSRFVYYFGEVIDEHGLVSYGEPPAAACGIRREMHVNHCAPGEESPIQVAFECSDGMGQVLVTKSIAEPDPDSDDGALRWLASGKTILNNKGKPVKQYEPYFSDVGHRCEDPEEKGVTPIMYYDAVGRLVRTELPDGSYSRVAFSPWFLETFDPNDTVLEPDSEWRKRHSPLDARQESQFETYAATPSVTHLDSLGREVVALVHNRHMDESGESVDDLVVTFTKLDAESKPLWIRDARNNRVMQYITPPIPAGIDDPDSGYMPCYDIAGNLLFQHSMDAGDRWVLNDAAGQPLYSWDSRNNVLRNTYDPLRRPQTLELRNDDHAEWIVVGGTRYGDESGVADAQARNLRGQAYRSYDQSGLVTTVRFDVNGNPLEVQRRIASAYESDENWSYAMELPPEEEPDDGLIEETYTQLAEYDALNRLTRQYQWHKGSGSRVAVIDILYNQRGLLQREEVVLDAIKTEDGFEEGRMSAMVQGISYNEKGQRLHITYGNETTTKYDYDPETFRLLRLDTLRHSDSKILQDLRYTYDPGGNITEIVDNAQPRVFFNNFRVDARNRYTYDALYRLVRAEGREHAGQVVHNSYDNWHDCVFKGRYHPNQDMAWRTYTERYGYDAVGNILTMRHTAHDDSAHSWTRQYQYERTSNRLLATGIGSGTVDHYPETPSLDYHYGYNIHGSMTSMPHLRTMEWDYTEHLHHIARTAGTLREGEDTCPDTSLEAWCRYDAAKQRVRKRVLKQQGVVEERLYLGGVEIFRRIDAAGEVTLERETLHVMDDQQRIALAETRTQGTDESLEHVVRYQLGNHLGSASLELDGDAQVITYEEYHPYGTTSYQAVHGDIEVCAKRYRYTAMERDEETGLNYHSARYYAVWLGRWVSCDPMGLASGVNIYRYASCNPTRNKDRSGLTDGDDHEMFEWEREYYAPDEPFVPEETRLPESPDDEEENPLFGNPGVEGICIDEPRGGECRLCTEEDYENEFLQDVGVDMEQESVAEMASPQTGQDLGPESAERELGMPTVDRRERGRESGLRRDASRAGFPNLPDRIPIDNVTQESGPVRLSEEQAAVLSRIGNRHGVTLQRLPDGRYISTSRGRIFLRAPRAFRASSRLSEGIDLLTADSPEDALCAIGPCSEAYILMTVVRPVLQPLVDPITREMSYRAVESGADGPGSNPAQQGFFFLDRIGGAFGW